MRKIKQTTFQPGYLSNQIFSNKYGSLIQSDAIDFLHSVSPNTIDLVSADPPYNIGNQSWDQFINEEDYISWTIMWIKEASRILKKNGSLYFCGYTEIVAQILPHIHKYFDHYHWLIWYYKNKANLRSDWGRSHESIIHFRKNQEFQFYLDEIRIPYKNHTTKYPEHSQSANSAYNQHAKGLVQHQSWSPHPDGARPRDVLDIPTVNNGSSESTSHPAQKPEELLRKLILASTSTGDLVIDPFSGSGTTLVAAQQLKRNWLGCDQNYSYNQIAINRIKQIKKRTIQEWINFDRRNYLRRNS